jgi:flagellar biosynthesis component FlhA
MNETREIFKQLIRDIVKEIINEEEIRQLLTPSQAEQKQQAVSVPEQSANQPVSVQIYQGLLSEKDVIRHLANNVNTIELAKAVIITPLAKDMARRKNVTITRISR